jgi:K+-sensing histidine kinase KdpD
MSHASPSLIGNNWAVRYAAAILATATMLLVRWALNPILGDYMPYILLCPAVAFSAWYCGIGPSLLSIVLAVAGAQYWIIPPIYSLQILSKAQVVGIVTFLCVSAALVAMGEAHRHARDELQKSHDELEMRMKESSQAHRPSAAIARQRAEKTGSRAARQCRAVAGRREHQHVVCGSRSRKA